MSDRFPLAAYAGERPPAPAWFRDSIAVPFTRHMINVDGADIAYQQWGNRDKPGLLLLHGNAAHAHWFDFIAPAFADDFNVVALDFSGSGNSDWRSTYSLEQFTAEQIAVMRATGMLDHAAKPIIAGHSLGGIFGLNTAGQYAELLKGLIIMDSGIKPPAEIAKLPRPNANTQEIFFPDFNTAIGRFRLMPSTPCDNHFILDHVARHGVKEITRDRALGWTWKFDPAMWSKFELHDEKPWQCLEKFSGQFAFLKGEFSTRFNDALKEKMLSRNQGPILTVNGANHHLFLENSSGTISALKDVLSAWEV